MFHRIKQFFGLSGQSLAPNNQTDSQSAPPIVHYPYFGYVHPQWTNAQINHPNPMNMPGMPPNPFGYPQYFGFSYPPMMYPGAQSPQNILPSQHPAYGTTAPALNPPRLDGIAVQSPTEVKKETESLNTKPVVSQDVVVVDKKPTNPSQDHENGRPSLWPNGNERREYLHTGEARKRKDTNWVWRSNGNTTHNGRQVELRVCLGVLSCANPACGRLVRPKTNSASHKLQFLERCQLCHSPLVNTTCSARSYHHKITKNGAVYCIWEHEGTHDHPRPPGGQLSADEEAALDAQVMRNPTASAHVLRTGDTTSGSVPLPAISPLLANPQAARYQIAQSRTRLGISSTSASKGGIATLKSLYELQSELDTPFIVNSSVHGPVFLTFQTPFMKKVLHESIHSWRENAEPSSITASGRRGFVTDGDHSFFREGVLNMTCVFSPLTLSWIPVLYTWILRQDIPHHRPHFRHISQSVVEYIQLKGIPFEPKYLLHASLVFDFSAAQRSAHAEEYADAVISLKIGFNELSKASQDIERNIILQQALETERGCSFHFWESAERIKSNGALVSQDKATEFNRLLRILVDNGTSKEEFDRTIGELHAGFPRILNWLSWWLRPTYRSMIFPAYSAIDPEIAVQVPHTSNAAEHSHSLLHSAVGADQDLIPGIKRLFLHVKQLESQYDSIKAGHYNPLPPRDPRRPAKKNWEQNDGRAPDTEAALNPRGVFDPSTVNTNHLLAYKWQEPNSCFVDNGLEIWFRAYSSWTEETKADFLGKVPSDSFLASLFYHFDRRFKQTYQETSVTSFRQNLSLMQTITLNRAFHKWQLISSPTAYGCAKTWLVHAVKDANPGRSIQEYFGLTHQIHRICSNGHTTSAPHAQLPEVLFTINDSDMHIAHAVFGAHVTTTGYFTHFIPRSRGGNYEGGTTPIHLLPDEPCSELSCTEPASVEMVSTVWPRIFTVNADVLRSDPEKLCFENSFAIQDHQGSCVTYDLVGRILHVHGDHFVSQLRLAGESYTYNDMQGMLHPSDNPRLLEIKDDNSVCYVYSRSSVSNTTSKSKTEIETDYARHAVRKSSKSVHFVEEPSPQAVLQKSPSSKTIFPLLDTYETLTYKLCDNCQLGGDHESLEMCCTLCKLTWHRDCLPLDRELDASMDDTWACPACVNPHGGLWDQTMIGVYVLLQPVAAARFYPAKILGRSSTQEVHVEWYPDNIYSSDDTSSTMRSIFTPLECLQALHRDPLFDYNKDNMGTIKWPIRLEEDAADTYGYKNETIRKALEDAYGAILEILLGEEDHPIVNIYNSWIKNRPRSNKMILQHHFNFTKQFSPSILPGDESLINPFLLYLRHDIKNAKELVETHWIDHVGLVLFRLVVLRTYLGRPACDDMQIFYLAYTGSNGNISPDDVYAEAKQGSIARILTTPEIALAACGSTRTLGIQFSLQRQIDPKNLLPGAKLAEALSKAKAPYTFFHTTASGLIGERKFTSSRLLEPELFQARNIPEKGRPKPRPRGKKATPVVPEGIRIIKEAEVQLKRPLSIEEWANGSRRSKRLRKV